jgi:hypothetical protein
MFNEFNVMRIAESGNWLKPENIFQPPERRAKG